MLYGLAYLVLIFGAVILGSQIIAVGSCILIALGRALFGGLRRRTWPFS